MLISGRLHVQIQVREKFGVSRKNETVVATRKVAVMLVEYSTAVKVMVSCCVYGRRSGTMMSLKELAPKAAIELSQWNG